MATMARRRSRAQKQNHPPPTSVAVESYQTNLTVVPEESPAIVAVKRAQPTTTTMTAAEATPYTKAGWSIRQKFEKAAYIIEEQHIVTFFLLIVYLDIILGTMSLTGRINNTAINILRRMILYIQCIELILQMILFHVRFFSHWGYCFDTILMGAKLFHGQYNIDISEYQLHMLSFLRVWRFIRVVQSYLAIEISRHKEELSSLIEYTTEYQRKFASAEEEIELLNEALTVAAIDAAEMNAAKVQYHKEGDIWSP
ncbi:hypothetical protein ACHAXH_007684 [Discostella pseudostelligera]